MAMDDICLSCGAYWDCEHTPRTRPLLPSQSVEEAVASVVAHTAPRPPAHWDRDELRLADFDPEYAPLIDVASFMHRSRQQASRLWFWQGCALPPEQLAEHDRIRASLALDAAHNAVCALGAAFAAAGEQIAVISEQFAAVGERLRAELQRIFAELAPPPPLVPNRAARRTLAYHPNRKANSYQRDIARWYRSPVRVR